LGKRPDIFSKEDIKMVNSEKKGLFIQEVRKEAEGIKKYN